MIAFMKERPVQELVDLIHRLRGDGGCPWDRELTLGQVIGSVIEEAYELAWAHEIGTREEILDELGDVLFLTVFAATLFREDEPGASIEAIAARAHEKITRRHPHVFGDEAAGSREESIEHWNRVKAGETRRQNRSDSALGDLMQNLPPLRRAEHVQRAAASVGFDWDDAQGIFDKLHEEVEEAKSVIADGSREEIKDEIGDLLFTIVNLSRFLDIDTEEALSRSNAKFIRRFVAMENLIKRDSRRLSDMTLEEMDIYWERVKKDST